MFYNPSALDLLRMFAGNPSESSEYLLSIFTDYADAAIVVFEINQTVQKIIPCSYWRISEQESNLVQGVLALQDEVPKGNTLFPLINSDTLNSAGEPTSSFLDLLHMEGITPYVRDSFTPLVGLTWFRQKEAKGDLDMSRFSVNERLRAELERVLTHKREHPSVLVMAFLQGLIYSQSLTSWW